MGGRVLRGVASHQGGSSWTEGAARVASPPVLLWHRARVLRLQGGRRVVVRPGWSFGTTHGHVGEACKGVVAVAGGDDSVGGGLLHVVLLPVQLEGGAKAGPASTQLTVSLPHPPDVKSCHEHHQEDHRGGGGAQGDEEGGGHTGQQHRLGGRLRLRDRVGDQLVHGNFRKLANFPTLEVQDFRRLLFDRQGDLEKGMVGSIGN